MTMIIQEGLWLCTDCTLAACNGDPGDVTEERLDAICAGMDRLGKVGHLACDFEITGDGLKDFAPAPVGGCACCHSTLAGEWHRFVLLA